MTDTIDRSEVDTDESGRPCFSSIEKDASSLDKELTASGFTKKDQDDIVKVRFAHLLLCDLH